MRTTPFSAFAVAASVILGVAQAQPLDLEKRTGRVQCSSQVYLSTDSLRYGQYQGYKPGQVVGKHTSEGGQVQTVIKTDGVDALKLNIRLCNSTHLGVSEADTTASQYNGDDYGVYGKLFLAEDESKCLQRHATLPSSNPSAETHMAIEDCSDVDDSRQARQFFYIEEKYGYISPIIGSGKQLNTVNLVLSDTSPQAVLAKRFGSDGGQGQQFLFK